jgi:hypothetical protein
VTFERRKGQRSQPARAGVIGAGVEGSVHLLSLTAPFGSNGQRGALPNASTFMPCLWYAFVVIRSMAVRETTKSFLWVFFAPVRV